MSEQARFECALTFCHQQQQMKQQRSFSFAGCCFLFHLCDTIRLKNIGAFYVFSYAWHRHRHRHNQLKCAHIFQRSYVSSTTEVYCMIYGRWKWIWVSVFFFTKFDRSFQCDRLTNKQLRVMKIRRKLVNELWHCKFAHWMNIYLFIDLIITLRNLPNLMKIKLQ